MRRMASPTPFAAVSRARRRGRYPATVLATEFCNQNLNTIDCDGNVSLLTTIPGPVRWSLRRKIHGYRSSSVRGGRVHSARRFHHTRR